MTYIRKVSFYYYWKRSQIISRMTKYWRGHYPPWVPKQVIGGTCLPRFRRLCHYASVWGRLKRQSTYYNTAVFYYQSSTWHSRNTRSIHVNKYTQQWNVGITIKVHTMYSAPKWSCHETEVHTCPASVNIAQLVHTITNGSIVNTLNTNFSCKCNSTSRCFNIRVSCSEIN